MPEARLYVQNVVARLNEQHGECDVHIHRIFSSNPHNRGDANLLRQVFVHRAGHCAFTPAETVTAFQTLIQRLDTGTWGDSTAPGLMNNEALALGSTLNTVPPAFIKFEPTVFLRPFDSRNKL